MTDLRIRGSAGRGRPVRFRVDGRTVEAYEGETVAAALWAAGVHKLRASPVQASPRGMFCLMGVCQECIVLIEGKRVTSCSVSVSEGLSVSLL